MLFFYYGQDSFRANQKVEAIKNKFKDKIEAIETGIRVGLAYHTLGTVSSPIEGFTKIKIRKNI